MELRCRIWEQRAGGWGSGQGDPPTRPKTGFGRIIIGPDFCKVKDRITAYAYMEDEPKSTGAPESAGRLLISIAIA
jgi:hypothetical protein